MSRLLKSSNNRRVITYLLLAVVHSLTASAIAVDSLLPPLFEPERIAWRRLSFKANSVLGKVTSDVRLKVVPVETAIDVLIKDPAVEAFQPSGATLLKLTVYSTINPLFGSDEYLTTESWLDPNGAGALQRVRLRQGNENWQKSYRFTKKGVFRLRKKPRDAREENLPLDQWTKIRNHFYPYGDKAAACSQILEPASLMCIASAIDLTPNPKPLSLCVFNKKQLHLVNVYVGDSQPLKVNYVQELGGKQIRIEKNIDAIRISFQPRSLAPEDKEPEQFSFLGLKGEFDIFIENISRIPVQVSGKTTAFGKIDIKLQEVEIPLPDP
jgi:hypothetical protein